MLRDDPDLNLSARFDAFPYQLDAVEAVKDLEYAALFHEQGLGKTKIAVDLLLHWLSEQSLDTVLVITKRALVENWRQEFEAHTHIKPRILNQDRKHNFFVLNSSARVILGHFEVVRSERQRLEMFLQTRRVGVILDEAQKIKNPAAVLSMVFHHLRNGFRRRVIMTGTPIANRPEDIWSQIYFLDGGEALGESFEEFRANLSLDNELHQDVKRQKEFAEALGSVFGKLRAFSIRETKDSTGIELPDKIVRTVSTYMSPHQAKLYDTYREEARAEVMRDGVLTEDDAEAVLKRLLRLVQVTSNPGLVDDDYREEPGKLFELMRLVRQATEDGSKVIVWTSFVQNANWLCEQLSEFGSVRVHGELPIDVRNRAIDGFKNKDSISVLVATPGAAKEGLTLTVANHAIYYDRTFSLDDYLQSQDRIHRISQTRDCYIWNLICEDTIDTWVDCLLRAKRLAAQLLQSDVTQEEYEGAADYDFGRAVAEILNPAVNRE
ncbi:DEAD/DEAH box helicase [Sulfitobacter sp. Ks41]|uniref:DEAD/DEAH box helicase n=1 Tax=Sulfitobacter sp. Ks41 TaxID=2731139 RepID=UPI0023E0F11B|nr:DEAD/DEAH box helicase [Sulfitobacter sp. Ks41]MDF3361947.1 DEAD/DEAH box helicase [Sulfitobacter sp. Ks41]